MEKICNLIFNVDDQGAYKVNLYCSGKTIVNFRCQNEVQLFADRVYSGSG